MNILLLFLFTPADEHRACLYTHRRRGADIDAKSGRTVKRDFEPNRTRVKRYIIRYLPKCVYVLLSRFCLAVQYYTYYYIILIRRARTHYYILAMYMRAII